MGVRSPRGLKPVSSGASCSQPCGAVRVTTTEGRGFEPLRACAQRFSRPPPYQLGLALPIAPRNLRGSALAGSPFSVRELLWLQTDVIGRRVVIELNRVGYQRGPLEPYGHTLRCAAGKAQNLPNGRRLGVDVGLAVPRESRSQGPLHVGKVTCGLGVGA